MNTALVNKTKFTYEGWIKINNPSMTDPYLQTIFSFGDNFTNDIVIYVQNNILGVQVNNGTDGGVGVSYTSNAWKYVSVVYDGTQSINSDRIKIYINGVFQPITVGGYTIPANTTTSTMSNCGIGAYSSVNFSSGHFGGFMGEVRLYSTALTSSEVLQNFNATKVRFGFFDTDAQAFITAASITNFTQQMAVNTLVTSFKTAGIWTKMKAIYPFVGGNATSHKFNLKDPRDLDAAYRLVFNGGWTHNANGATPNGTNGYARTSFVGTNLSPNSSSYSIYNRSVTPSTKNIIDFGYFRLNSSYISNLFTTYYDGTYGGRVNSWNGASLPQTSPQGFYNGNRTNSTDLNFFKNGTKIMTASDNTAGKLQIDYQFHLGCLFIDGAYYDNFSTNNYAFAHIGDGLTDAEATAFYNAVQAFQTTLGRQV